MSRVFLAAPFKSKIDPESGLLSQPLRQLLSDLIDFFEGQGMSVHNAHRREAWGREMTTPEECTRIDFQEIEKCDWFVALPGSPTSPGTHVEIGWASAMGKQITLLLEANKEHAFLVLGLHSVAPVEIIRFTSPEDCVRQIRECSRVLLPMEE